MAWTQDDSSDRTLQRRLGLCPVDDNYVKYTRWREVGGIMGQAHWWLVVQHVIRVG